MAEPGGAVGSPSMVPIPDPTSLTTDAVRLAVAAERDYVHGQVAIIEQRLAAMDRATELLNSQMTAVPTDVDKQVGNLKALHDERFASVREQAEQHDEQDLARHAFDRAYVEEKFVALIKVTDHHAERGFVDEKFASVAQQFKERDTRSERESRDNKVAVDAAFAAQKEAASEQNKSNTLAISKSETATAETITKLQDLVATQIKSLEDKIDDIKKNEARLESRQDINQGKSTGVNAAYVALVGLVGLAATILTIVLALNK